MANLTIKRLFRRKPRLYAMDKFQKIWLVILSVCAIFMLLPIFYIFNHALKPYHELFAYPPNIFVRDATFQNFTELFSIANSTIIPLSRYLFNSIFVSVTTVIAVVLVSAMCAYPMSKHRFPGSKIFFATILITLMFAPETVGITRYLVVAKLGIMNTYFGHILPFLAAPVGVFLMRQFMDQVPNELIEAAKVDGAREFTIFLKIVIPMTMPALATVAIFTFQSVWGDVSTSTEFMQVESMKTFPFFLSTLTSNLANTVARQGAAAAAGLLMFLPNLIIFVLFQRKVIATMAHSGIK